MAETDVCFWHKADVAIVLNHVRLKRTWPVAVQMSAFDPKRTWLRSRLGATNGTILDPKM
jgi:hypothetical protein